MKRDERKKLTANELYLQECMSILYTKTRASTFNFFSKNGTIKKKIFFNIEGYTHGTITCTYNENALRMCYDGTNFSPIFASNNKGGFIYKLKPLELEYICYDKELENSIRERRIVRIAGGSADYYKYLCRDGFFILLEHDSKDESGITIVKNKDASNCSNSELVEYFENEQNKASEMEEEHLANIPLAEDNEVYDDDFMPDSVEQGSTIISELSEKDLKEIEAYVDCDDDKSLYEIDYSQEKLMGAEPNETPYFSRYPEHIEDFDYEKYIESLDYADNKASKNTEHSQNYSEHNELLDEEKNNDDDGNLDIEQEDSDDDFSKEVYSISDTITSEDGFIDDSAYVVVHNNKFVHNDKKVNAVEESVTSVMDVNLEFLTLADYYNDILTEIKKMKQIIIRRKEQMEKRSEYDTMDNSNPQKRDDKNIE